MGNVVQLIDVDKQFRGRRVLRRASVTIGEGEACAITGPNGSGKTVVLRLMCGFLQPDRGSVHIDPRYLSSRRTFPEHFGIILDRPGFQPNRTGLDNLYALAAIRRDTRPDQVASAMETLGLDPELPQPVARYSMGMKQRLAIAQAIMEDQRVLVLDEPFNAPDEDGVRLVHDVLTARLADGCTVIFTSHHRSDVETLAHRAVAIRDHQLVEA